MLEARTEPITSERLRSEVEAMLAKVKRLPRVASPYGPYSASQVSRDGKIAFTTVNFDAQAQDLAEQSGDGVADADPTSAVTIGVIAANRVGIDYALFIVTRHRSGVRAGQSIEDAAVNAINTAGRAVFFAGVTVAIALLGQFTLGLSFLYGVAISATVTVVLTMLASLTLLPALLSFIGPKVLGRRERRRIRKYGPEAEGGHLRPVVPVVALDRAPHRVTGRGRPARGGRRRHPGDQPPARDHRRRDRPGVIND